MKMVLKYLGGGLEQGEKLGLIKGNNRNENIVSLSNFKSALHVRCYPNSQNSNSKENWILDRKIKALST